MKSTEDYSRPLNTRQDYSKNLNTAQCTQNNQTQLKNICLPRFLGIKPNQTLLYNLCELIHFCHGLKRHHILKEDRLSLLLNWLGNCGLSWTIFWYYRQSLTIRNCDEFSWIFALTLHSMGEAVSAPPLGFRTLKPSIVIWGVPDFDTIHIWYL